MISSVPCQPHKVFLLVFICCLKNLFFGEIIVIQRNKHMNESFEHIDTIPAEQGALGILNDVEEKFDEIRSKIDKALNDETDMISNALMNEYKEQLRSLAKELAYILIPEKEPEHTIVQEKFTDIIDRITDTESKLHLLGKGFLSGIGVSDDKFTDN